MQLILLAAGKGSRLKSKTKKIPKCLIKINNKSIIDYNKKFLSSFEKVIIITGFKSHILNNKFKNKKNFKFINNINYKKTNMVESMVVAKPKIDNNKDIVICYSDIIFDYKILNNIKKKEDLMIVNSNWLKYWKLRTNGRVWKDAEDIKISKGKLIEIGKKIEKNNIPKFQYMGIFKLKYKSYLKICAFYKKIKNKKIDMTSFINLLIKSKILKFKVKTTKKFWIEIDNNKDLIIAKNLLKRSKLW